MSELREQYEQFIELYNELKNRIRREEPSQFNRWKAGGFIVDDDIMSMYPNIVTILELMIEQEEMNDLADSLEENEEIENDE